ACALCRREDYNRLLEIWSELHPGQIGADAIDAQLHCERVHHATRSRELHDAPMDGLPDGAFVLHESATYVVIGPELRRWTPAGYESPAPRPRGSRARLITPPSLVAVLRAGWDPLVPLLHPSAF